MAVFSWGFGVAFAALAGHVTALEYAGVLVGIVGGLSMFAIVPLINAFNQPAFLVPPSRRDEPGTWTQRRERRAHKRTGRPIGLGDKDLDPVDALRKQAAKHSSLKAEGPLTITA
jgi:hypothetical protein